MSWKTGESFHWTKKATVWMKKLWRTSSQHLMTFKPWHIKFNRSSRQHGMEIALRRRIRNTRETTWLALTPDLKMQVVNPQVVGRMLSSTKNSGVYYTTFPILEEDLKDRFEAMAEYYSNNDSSQEYTLLTSDNIRNESLLKWRLRVFVTTLVSPQIMWKAIQWASRSSTRLAGSGVLILLTSLNPDHLGVCAKAQKIYMRMKASFRKQMMRLEELKEPGCDG